MVVSMATGDGLLCFGNENYGKGKDHENLNDSFVHSIFCVMANIEITAY